jgi:hypothetical protein
MHDMCKVIVTVHSEKFQNGREPTSVLNWLTGDLNCKLIKTHLTFSRQHHAVSRHLVYWARELYFPVDYFILA